MHVVLLLGGKSKRFWPLNEKSLFPLCGTRLLTHQLECLRAAGLSEITVVGGSHNLEATTQVAPGLRMVEQQGTGMLGALLSALPGCTGPVMVVSGNDVIQPAGYAAVAKTINDGADGALLARRVERYFPGGYLTVDGDKVTGVLEKPGEGNEPSDLVNIVAHGHRDAAALLEALRTQHNDQDDGYERALASLCTSKRYLAVPYEGPWHPVKYPWDLLPLLAELLKGVDAPSIHPSVTVHPSAVIDGNVVIGEGTRVLAHATIVGPCVIGRNCVIANNALVRGSSIGDGCVVGYATEVCRSVLAGDVWTHMTYLGDSIIGHNVSFGGGTITGNLRLDEEEIASGEEKISTGLVKFGAAIGNDCRLGIHVSLLPGVKIGGGTFISGGTVVGHDLPDATFAQMKNGTLEVRPNRTQAPQPLDRERFRGSLGLGK